MNAFHCNWTAPFFAREEKKAYYIEDFELLTTILSALKWRQHNGSIKMVTDKVGAAYYKQMGIEAAWDLGIDDGLDDCIPKCIDVSIFWAAGKLYALQRQEVPCVMIDTDFIVWKDIRDILKQSQVSIIHREPLLSDVYPSKNTFNMNESYYYHNEWDWNELPCNTAFAYFGEKSFKEYYVDEAIRFMTNMNGGLDRLTYMIFAEQRMLALCAKEKGISIQSLMELKTLHSEQQDTYTHIWGYKREIKKDDITRESFCRRCIRRIIEDFPGWEERLMEIPILERYFE